MRVPASSRLELVSIHMNARWFAASGESSSSWLMHFLRRDAAFSASPAFSAATPRGKRISGPIDACSDSVRRFSAADS